MSQDLRQMSQEGFKLRIHSLTIDQLKDLLVQIYELKTTYGNVMRDDEIMDIERKETKINFELMRRGYLKKVDYDNYFQWLKKINKKKKVW